MRLFIGLSIPKQSCDQLEQWSQKLAALDTRQPMRWISRFNYHLTLAFLGEVKTPTIDPLLMQLEQKLSHQQVVNSRILEISLFPFTDRPKVVAALVENSDAIRQLHKQVVKAINRLPIKCDNKHFHPHISLARVHLPAGFRITLAPIALDQKISFSEVVLYQSELKPYGAVYTPLFSMPLD